MEIPNDAYPSVLHWNYRGFTDFPLQLLNEDQIKDIYLKENRICRLPQEIARLRNLESLYLSGNDIRVIPKEIGLLTRLKCLDLSGNRVEKLPEEIGDVVNLQYLILDDNDVGELPLRIGDLRRLRYLSVCDNRLQWLSPRIVYNYHHCEFRFWRNRELACLPYSLWYHMFRNQQIRSLGIGCLSVAGNAAAAIRNRCILKMHSEEAEWKIGIPLPRQYNRVMSSKAASSSQIPTLLEICKRALYQMLYLKTKEIYLNAFDSFYSDDCDSHAKESDLNENSDVNGNDIIDSRDKDSNNNTIIISNESEIMGIEINTQEPNIIYDSSSDYSIEINENYRPNETCDDTNNCVKLIFMTDESVEDERSSESKDIINDCIETQNGTEENKNISTESIDNNCFMVSNNTNEHHININQNYTIRDQYYLQKKSKPKVVTTSELVDSNLYYLPDHLKADLKHGPVSRCENLPCRKPVFNYAFIQFCKGKLILIDVEQEIILSAVFCSSACSQEWACSDELIPWEFAGAS